MRDPVEYEFTDEVLEQMLEFLANDKHFSAALKAYALARFTIADSKVRIGGDTLLDSTDAAMSVWQHDFEQSLNERHTG